MCNTKICEELEKQFNIANTLQFCKMEAVKYKLLAEHYFNVNEAESHREALYEEEWWTKKAEKLKNNIKNQLLGL